MEDIIELIYLLRESKKHFKKNKYFIYLLDTIIIPRIEQDTAMNHYSFKEDERHKFFEFKIDFVVCLLIIDKEKDYYYFSFSNILNDKYIVLRENLKADINDVNRILFDIFD